MGWLDMSRLLGNNMMMKFNNRKCEIHCCVDSGLLLLQYY
jgi:hypothetical protein